MVVANKPSSHLKEGIYAALWNPTDPHGDLLESSLKRHLGFLAKTKLAGLMVNGSTGEFPVLTEAERMIPLKLARELAPALEIIYHASHPRFATMVEMAKNAVQQGVAAIALLPPWFFPMPQDDLGEFFVRAAEAWGHTTPLLLYNYPEVTGKRLDLETIAWIADRAPVCALKQSGAEFAYHQELIDLGRQKNFQVITGADTRLAEALGLGAAGCISGLANAVPEWVCGLFEAVRTQDRRRAQEFTEKITRVEELIRPLPFALNIGAVVEARGFAPGAPKYIRSPVTMEKYQKAVQQLTALLEEEKLERPG